MTELLGVFLAAASSKTYMVVLHLKKELRDQDLGTFLTGGNKSLGRVKVCHPKATGDEREKAAQTLNDVCVSSFF